MDLLALPIGTIIVYAGLMPVPSGWNDITGSAECVREIEIFRSQHPDAGEFIANDPLFCIKKIEAAGVS